jgi:hypothetical protein
MLLGMKRYLSVWLLSMELRSKTPEREEVKPKTGQCCESQKIVNNRKKQTKMMNKHLLLPIVAEVTIWRDE